MLSLCLTNYNRYEMLLESFQHVYDDPRISEIVISDDCSKLEIFEQLLRWVFENDTLGKIILRRNEQNLGMSLNKKESIVWASNNWCILFDSDNILKTDYLDALDGKMFPKDVIFCPDFAMPSFDYTHLGGEYIERHNVRRFLQKKLGDVLLNTCNYVVHRESYLEVYKHNPAIKGSDTIDFNYRWLRSGRKFYVVPGMRYFHRVHEGSGFMADADYNLRQAEQTKKLIMQL